MRKLYLLISFFLIVIGSFGPASYAHAMYYPPGSTLDPGCLPTDPSCGVATTTYAFSSGLSESNGNVTNTGLLSILQSYGASQIGNITLATSSQAYNGLTVGINITNSGGTFTFTPSLSGTLTTGGGGTGLASAPTYGQLLVGNGLGGYTLIATSTLGINSGTWGNITGTLSNQTDLQSALDNKFSLSAWFATTTDALAEGVNHLYFTNARADARINATSTIGTLTSAPNLGTLSTSLSGVLHATAGVLTAGAVNLTTDITNVLGVTNGGTGLASTPGYGQLLVGNGSGGYALTATSSLGINSGIWGNITGTLSNQTDLQNALNAKFSLASWFATTTDALAEGVKNLYFTNARADARINATSTIGTLTSAPNLGTVSTSLNGVLHASAGVLTASAVNLATDISGILGVQNGGTGSTTLTGLLKGNGTGSVQTAIAGVDYLVSSSLSGLYPILDNNNAFSLAFGTTTANSWSGLQQFNGNASTTQLSAGLAYFGQTATSTFTSNGSLGIGTSSPSATLAVNGNALFTGNASTTGMFGIGGLAIYSGSGAPAASLPEGSLYLRTDTSALYRMWTPTGTTAPSYVQGNIANGTSVSLGSATTVGNVLFGFCNSDTNAGDPSVNSGWTSLSFQPHSSWANGALIVYQIVASGSTGPFAPCAGATGSTAVVEVSGINTSNINGNIVGVVWGQNTSGSSKNITSSVSSASSNLGIVMSGSGGGQSSAVASFTGGTWSNLLSVTNHQANYNTLGVATQIFSSSTVSPTGNTSPAQNGITIGVLVLQPTPASQTSGWQQMSDLTVLKNGGSSITTDPRSINFTSGLTAFDDGSGNTTVSIASTTPLSWSALQQFNGNASTTALSAGIAYFGTIATSSFASNGALTLAQALTVPNGGTGSTTLSGLLKGNGTGAVQTAVAGVDYLLPSSLSALFPLIDSSNVFSLAFGTTTTNSWSGLQQFNGNASTTQLSAGLAYFGQTATSTFASNGWLAIGTSTPLAPLTIWGPNALSTAAALSIANNASTTLFDVFDNGNVGIGTTSPAATLGINGTLFVNGNATTTGSLGIGGISIISGSGVPTATYAQGSLYARTDQSLLYRMSTLNNAIPTEVQDASAGGATVTLSQAPAAGDYLIGICNGGAYGGGMPAAASGWTTLTTVASGDNFVEPNVRIVYAYQVGSGSTTQSPCTAGTLLDMSVIEVSGLSSTNISSNYEGIATSTTHTVTSSATLNNTLAIAIAAGEDVGTDCEVFSFNSGWANTSSGCRPTGDESIGSGVATQFFLTSGSTINNTSTPSPGDNGQTSIIIQFAQTPGTTPNWQQMSDLTTLSYGGTTITTDARSLNFTKGLFAIDDGNGDTTVSLASSTSNTFTALQQFNGNASTTALSAGIAYFGQTATSSFASNGALTLAQALGISSGGTGTTTGGFTNGVEYFNGTLYTNSGKFVFNGSQVGIGTSTPYSPLTIWGPDTLGGTAALTISNNASTTEFQVFDNGNATLAGTLTQNSDQRLKTNIVSLDASSSLAAIEALNPVTYNWIDPSRGTQPQLGFIAQEVAQIFPQLVSTTSPTPLTPDGTLGINYSGFIAPIVESIKQLVTEVNGFTQSVTTAVINATNGNFGTVQTNTLCVGSTCVTEDQLKVLLQESGQTPTVLDTSGDGTSSSTSDSSSDTSDTSSLTDTSSSTPSDTSNASDSASSTPDTSSGSDSTGSAASQAPDTTNTSSDTSTTNTSAPSTDTASGSTDASTNTSTSSSP